MGHGVRDAVATGRGKGAVHTNDGHSPAAHLLHRCHQQRLPGGGRVGVAHQPTDVPAAAIALADLVIGAEAVQQRCRDDAVLELGNRAMPFGDPRVDDALAGLTFQM